MKVSLKKVPQWKDLRSSFKRVLELKVGLLSLLVVFMSELLYFKGRLRLKSCKKV